MTTIMLEPARSQKAVSVNHSRYLLRFASEIAEELPATQVVVKYGRGDGDKMSLNSRSGEVELF